MLEAGIMVISEIHQVPGLMNTWATFMEEASHRRWRGKFLYIHEHMWTHDFPVQEYLPGEVHPCDWRRSAAMSRKGKRFLAF